MTMLTLGSCGRQPWLPLRPLGKTGHRNSFLPNRGDATGVWGSEDVQIGSTTIKDYYFAVVNRSIAIMGVLGVGLMLLEVTVGPSYSGSTLVRNCMLRATPT